MPLTQSERLMSIHTPLGPDAFLLQGFSGHEGISQLFKFDLDLLREGEAFSHEEVVGQMATIQLILRGDETRYFNGYISRLTQLSSETGLLHYRAEMVPWLWFLTRTADCRIFQNKTVPDIIEQIFTEYGFRDYELQLGTYPEREYCVQYRETDFNFVSRLLEQYGIFYFWKHEEDKHTLILGDQPTSHQALPINPQIFWEAQGSGSHEADVITSLEFEKDIRPGKYTHRDFNFTQNPAGRLIEHEEPSVIDFAGNSAFEVYDYPGEFPDKAQAESIGTVRMQEEEAQHFTISGSSNCREFVSGSTFDLIDYEPDTFNQTYVLVRVFHNGSMGRTYTGGGDEGGQESYSNTFSCIPHSVPFRPPQLTPKPVVQGPQTAIVVGKDGEIIWTDQYGRVKVQFHWDREGEGNENSSCWVRLSQLWAGKKWGAMFLPRIGQEVIVEFLEGDPDRPIVTGRVYNNECMPALDLPDEQYKSYIITDRKNGIRFNDKEGEEEVLYAAEKDQKDFIRNDQDISVGNDQHKKIFKNQYEQIFENQHRTVGMGRFTEIQGDDHLTIGGDQNEKVSGTVSLTTDADLQQKVSGSFAVGAGDIHLNGGQNVVIEAGSNLTLKVGGSFVVISAGGVDISGPMVNINSGGAAGSGSGASPAEPDAPELPRDWETESAPERAAPPENLEPPSPEEYSPAAAVLQQAAEDGTPFCEQCEAARQAAAGGE